MSLSRIVMGNGSGTRLLLFVSPVSKIPWEICVFPGK